MAGRRIRRDPGLDVPFFAAGLIVFGGVIATVVRVLTDIVLPPSQHQGPPGAHARVPQALEQWTSSSR